MKKVGIKRLGRPLGCLCRWGVLRSWRAEGRLARSWRGQLCARRRKSPVARRNTRGEVDIRGGACTTSAGHRRASGQDGGSDETADRARGAGEGARAPVSMAHARYARGALTTTLTAELCGPTCALPPIYGLYEKSHAHTFRLAAEILRCLYTRRPPRALSLTIYVYGNSYT